MADLVISGNTHKNVNYLRVKKSDGTTAVFVDYSRRDKRQPDAKLSVTYGEAFALSASITLGKPTANLTKEI